MVFPYISHIYILVYIYIHIYNSINHINIYGEHGFTIVAPFNCLFPKVFSPMFFMVFHW